MQRKKLLPYLEALFAVVAWGASFIATKIAVSQILPITVVWLRFSMGVMVLDQEEPQRQPAIGSIVGGGAALNLYAVRVDWASVSNPRCPLFGPPTTS